MQNISKIISNVFFIAYHFIQSSLKDASITQNKGKESENSYQKLKSSWWTGIRTHTHGNKIEIFRQTRPSFSIRRERMIEKDGRVRRNILILFPCVCSCACPP